MLSFGPRTYIQFWHAFVFLLQVDLLAIGATWLHLSQHRFGLALSSGLVVFNSTQLVEHKANSTPPNFSVLGLQEVKLHLRDTWDPPSTSDWFTWLPHTELCQCHGALPRRAWCMVHGRRDSTT